MTRRDYLNPDYPPALCDEAERADRVAHFAPTPAPDGTPHGAAVVIIAALVILAAIILAALGVV